MEYILKKIEYDIPNLCKYADLLNIVFKEKIPKTVDFLDWEYNQNPLGKAYGYDAFYKDELVAHYSAQPIISNIEGKITKGLLALHVAIHPGHRGKGLFTEIHNRTHEKAISDGFEFVMAVANNMSAPRCVKALDFKIIRRLDARIGFGVPHKDDYDKSSYSYYRIWDKDTIEWRLKDPSYKHIVREKKGILTVFAPTHINYFSAIIAQMKQNEFGSIKIDEEDSVNFLRVWLGIDKNMKWKTSFILPEKLKPSPLNLIYLNFKDSSHRLDGDSLFFNNIDFDAF